MGKVIALVNQKGGVGKTTTSINLSASLAVLGKKVLLIDLDPQGNTTTGVGINKGDIDLSVYDVLINKCSTKDAMIKTKYKKLYVLPATINLAGLDIELLEKSQSEPGFAKGAQLKYHLKELEDENFDFIIIDCPPSLGLITTNALTASDSVIILSVRGSLPSDNEPTVTEDSTFWLPFKTTTMDVVDPGEFITLGSNVIDNEALLIVSTVMICCGMSTCSSMTPLLTRAKI